MPVKILQATDLHLPEHYGELQRGVSNDQRWEQVLSAMCATHPDADLLVLTGDLVTGGHDSAYKRLRQHLADKAPLIDAIWLPGNHDDLSVMAEVDQTYTTTDADTTLRKKRSLCRTQWQKGAWQLVFLDSSAQADGKGLGSLSESSIQLLEALNTESAAEADCALNTLVAVHHHVMPVGSGWQDDIMMANADLFWELIAPKPMNQKGMNQKRMHQKPLNEEPKSDKSLSGQVGLLPPTNLNVKAVMVGHVHQVHRSEHLSVKLFSSPATAPQFKPHCDTFTLEEGLANRPAYSVYELYDDGSIHAKVEYVDV